MLLLFSIVIVYYYIFTLKLEVIPYDVRIVRWSEINHISSVKKMPMGFRKSCDIIIQLTASDFNRWHIFVYFVGNKFD